MVDNVDTELDRCSICLSNPCEVALKPCGHLFCQGCIYKLVFRHACERLRSRAEPTRVPRPRGHKVPRPLYTALERRVESPPSSDSEQRRLPLNYYRKVILIGTPLHAPRPAHCLLWHDSTVNSFGDSLHGIALHDRRSRLRAVLDRHGHQDWELVLLGFTLRRFVKCPLCRTMVQDVRNASSGMQIMEIKVGDAVRQSMFACLRASRSLVRREDS